jgi:hypothetical protein
MSVTGSGVSAGLSEWVSVTEAAGLSRVSERTIQRWVEAGKVVSEVSDDGRRLVRRASLPGEDGRPPGGPGPAGSLWARVSDRMADRAGEGSDAGSDRGPWRSAGPMPAGGFSGPAVAAAGRVSDTLSDAATDVVECPARSDARQGVSEITTTLRADAAERERELLRQERDRLVTDVEYLRAQLDARTAAEEQLRVMMARMEQTNSQLAAVLAPRALPPGPEPAGRVRWFWPFGRRA